MLRNRLFFTFALAFVLLQGTTSGWTQSRSQSAAFTLRAVVPVVCRLTPQGTSTTHRLVVEEFCNVPAGYRVYAVHPPGLGGQVAFAYGGRRVIAESDGETLLLDAPTAAKVLRELRIQTAGPAAPPPVALRIVPK